MLACTYNPIAWEVGGKSSTEIQFSFSNTRGPRSAGCSHGMLLFTLSHSLPNPSHSPFAFMVTWPCSANILTSFGIYSASILNIKIHTNSEKKRDSTQPLKHLTNLVVAWFLGHCHKGTERKGERKKLSVKLEDMSDWIKLWQHLL